MKYFLGLIILIASLCAHAEERTNLNLTKCIQQIERQHQITISYSPSATDTIYPITGLAKLMSENTAKDKLLDILQGTGYGVGNMKDLFYLYKLPEVEICESDSLITGEEVIERDTLKVPVLLADSITYQPDTYTRSLPKLKGVSTWDYLTPLKTQPESMKLAFYSNLLLWATGSMNIGTSIGLSPKWTIGGMVSYNPWMYGKARIKHIMIRPEVRYWLCDNFGGHFLSTNLAYVRYNVGRINLPLFSENIKNNRYQGNLGGLGFSYGYSWLFGKRMNLEVEIGVGIIHTKYTKYPCKDCGHKIKTGKKTFVSPNKFAVNLVYVLK